MSKPKSPRALAETEAQAVARNVRVSPRKMDLAAGLIRGRKAQDAVAILAFSKRGIAPQVKKVLESAIANAENNHGLDVDRLVVARAEVGRSAVMKRFHARGRGRSSRIEKWFSHLKIVVAERQTAAAADAAARDDEEEATPPAAAPAPVATPAAPATAAAQVGGAA